jgi:hypothetical protein
MISKEQQELESLWEYKLLAFTEKHTKKILVCCFIILAICGWYFYIFFYNYNKGYDAAMKLKNEAIANNIAEAKDGGKNNNNTNSLQEIDKDINFSNTAAIYKETSQKLDEVNNLRSEIANLLKGDKSQENLNEAQVKIFLLQEKVGLLQSRFLDISEENKRLQLLLNQMLASGKLSYNNSKIKTYKQEETAIPVVNIETAKVNSTNAAIATGLHLFAVADNNETNQSVDADKIVGTFMLKNITNKANAEVVVVVLQPDGTVLKNSVWESGTFETREGKKVYSRKIIFESESTEKQVNFSLSPDNFSKGNYTMQVWYNGSMIAKTVKSLS